MSESPDPRAFARVILATAADLEAAERQIREDIAEAAIKGDCAKVLEVFERWTKLPTIEASLQKRRDSA